MAGLLFVSLFLHSIITTSGCGSDNKCLQKKCTYDNVIPTCILGCEDGYTGNFCQEICRNWCLACARTDSSTCTKCDEGRHGKTCEKRCDGCVDNQCHPNGTCVTRTVTCPPGCKDGLCDESGYCIHGCNVPFYGHTCNKACPPDCKGCDQDTGACLNKCNDSFSGPDCTEPNCTMFCEDCLNERKPEICSLLQGPCENRCEVNFSFQCKDACPEDCELCEVCGVCMKCVKGRYGTNCSETCLGCKDLLCQHNGTCMGGCAEGYSGELCDVLHQNATSSTDLWSTFLELVERNELFLPLIVCALVLLLAVTGFLIWMCRRRRKTERIVQSRQDSQCAFICPNNSEPAEFSKCGDIYHEIDDKDLDPEPTDNTRVRLLSPRPPLPLPNTQKGCAHHGADQYMTAKHDIHATQDPHTTTSLLGAEQYMTAMHDVNATQGPHTITNHSHVFRELAVVRESRFRGKCGNEAVLILPGMHVTSERSVIIEGVSALDAQGYLTPGQALTRGCNSQSDISIKMC